MTEKTQDEINAEPTLVRLLSQLHHEGQVYETDQQITVTYELARAFEVAGVAVII